MLKFENVTEVIWNHVKALAQLHNKVAVLDCEEIELQNYVFHHKNELNHPHIISVLIEHISITNDFLQRNAEFCKVVYQIIGETSFENTDMGLSDNIRLESFKELMSELQNA
ncbi:hypothetical protein [Bacillus thuringiensis]|uniref:Uncharacterized protein n=1 Tax=Bacillus thuringiensis TaxID=1428 RepID=A0A9X6WHM4_BACTU|nr:hypothetical protein [Bacillus thuringiensis]PFJ29004.1 hypothetical protein COJ15_32585 [Bacillus thuringiensis]